MIGRARALVQERLREVPVPLRQGLVGFVVLGFAGGFVGLVVGLQAYVPTAWAAVFEVGIPAAFLGGVLGLGFGCVMRLSSRGHEH